MDCHGVSVNAGESRVSYDRKEHEGEQLETAEATDLFEGRVKRELFGDSIASIVQILILRLDQIRRNE